jgi:hypothetical protein
MEDLEGWKNGGLGIFEIVPTRSLCAGAPTLDAERPIFGSNAEHWRQFKRSNFLTF